MNKHQETKLKKMGIFSRSQAEAMGISHQSLSRLVAEEKIIRVPPNQTTHSQLYRLVRTKMKLDCGIINENGYRIVTVERAILEGLKMAKKIGERTAVQAVGNECRVKITTFHMQTFQDTDTYRDITLDTAEMKFEDLFFKRLTNGKGNMELNSLYKINDKKNTYSYSHFVPDASFRRSGRFLDWDRVLRSTAELDLNDKRILKIKYQKTFSFEGEKEVTCSNLERLPKLIHLKETIDQMNQSFLTALSNLDKYYGNAPLSRERMLPQLLEIHIALESYLNQLNNGTDPDTILNKLPDVSRQIQNLSVVLYQTPYITVYIENAFYILEDFNEYSN